MQNSAIEDASETTDGIKNLLDADKNQYEYQPYAIDDQVPFIVE